MRSHGSLLSTECLPALPDFGVWVYEDGATAHGITVQPQLPSPNQEQMSFHMSGITVLPGEKDSAFMHSAAPEESSQKDAWVRSTGRMLIQCEGPAGSSAAPEKELHAQSQGTAAHCLHLTILPNISAGIIKPHHHSVAGHYPELRAHVRQNRGRSPSHRSGSQLAVGSGSIIILTISSIPANLPCSCGNTAMQSEGVCRARGGLERKMADPRFASAPPRKPSVWFQVGR